MSANIILVNLYFHLEFSKIITDARFFKVSRVLRANKRGVDVG